MQRYWHRIRTVDNPPPTGGKSEESTQESRTYTQEEVDKLIADNKQQVSSQFADYKDLQSKAAKYDEIESREQEQDRKTYRSGANS